MDDMLFRTEDIQDEDIFKYYVETQRDIEIVTQLKSKTPVILVGSRGVGKSFLMRVAEQEMLRDFEVDRVFPIYLTFHRSSLLRTNSDEQFKNWMMSHICNRLLRTIRRKGFALTGEVIEVFAGGKTREDDIEDAPIVKLSKAFDESWRSSDAIDSSAVPSIDEFKDAIQDLCEQINAKRIVILIDEAAHILVPAQQRIFFSLFRDLRSPYLGIKAAVYPGATYYGESFQASHDATFVKLIRDIKDASYVSNMKAMIIKQIENPVTLSNIESRGDQFSILAYAASGNPRSLIKSLGLLGNITSRSVENTIRTFYRDMIWADHQNLAEKFPPLAEIIDWSREFIDAAVIPDLLDKSSRYITLEKDTTCYFWVAKDIPATAKEGLRLLEYTGVIFEDAVGLIATRRKVGTRYRVNLGCMFAKTSNSSLNYLDLARNVTPKRMMEITSSHPLMEEAAQINVSSEPDNNQILNLHLDKSIEVLDLTEFQKDRLRSIKIETVYDLLNATHEQLQKAHLVGEVRSRRMRDSAITSLFEYLSG
ncbi:ORC-CDC6 family AAA ATPase [Deinococcus aquiradiocola]|uniref:Uncharacterized protein n=1 Tax=Deinococcus aquiradiocola TaxID=393059 RepID=A0A917UT82_9DEIO|nr:hypothetical protein [Deinococcus aquiradiocola]GGJ83741.1 hypothetical protein GCM10008939_29460 [Deinococcus aquiradiocola]